MNNKNSNRIGAYIKLLREKKLLNQRELGEMVNVTQPAIADIESGRRRPSLPLLIKIAEALDSTPNIILGVEPLEAAQPTPDLQPKPA